MAVAPRGVVSNFTAPSASMDSDYLAGFAAHADAWEIFVFVMVPFAAVTTGLVVDMAESARAWVVISRLVLGEEAELG